MDEQAIRQWAWTESAARWKYSREEKEPFVAMMYAADALAAWVMSGRFPETQETEPPVS